MTPHQAAFRAYFAGHIGRISALFRTVPGLDTGHDGIDIWLYSPDDAWVASAQPVVSKGHNGRWAISMAHKVGGRLAPWSTFELVFDASGTIMENE